MSIVKFIKRIVRRWFESEPTPPPQIRRCVLNDCTNFDGIAYCCLDCPERERCPDKCHKTDTIYCVGVIEENDPNQSRSIKKESAIH